MKQWHWSIGLEGIVLLLAIPLLLYPDFFPVATTAILLLLGFSWLISWQTTKQPFPATPLNSPLLLFILMLAIGILVSADLDLTLPKATGLLLGVALWRYMILTIQNQHTFLWGVGAFSILGAGIIITGILSADWNLKVGFLEKIIPLLPSRLIVLPDAPSEGVHANSLAGVFTLFVPFSLSLLIAWRPTRLKTAVYIFLVFSFVITTGLLLLTQSRSGWIGAFIGLGALLFLWSNLIVSAKIRQSIWLGFALVLIIGIVALAWIDPTKLQMFIGDPVQKKVIGDFSTIGFRLEVWEWAIEGIRDFPFTGTGLGAFRRVIHRFYPIDVRPNYDIAHAHNIFLQTALDVGLPGLIAYLAMLSIVGFMGWQVAKHNEQLRPFALGLLASLIAFHTYGLTDALALGSKPGILFWMALGLLTAMFNCSSEQASQRSS